ncbi:prepilin-type N-terminal cleavage/methylation domain-containing protein [Vibrio panuliri]|uniref:MSHA biogenesis protein MshB n=1 Tax=Vibrio panuliri TaxID=1381081 RepID=A0A1Q9HC47_9VIBR|nr:prepilin-type N-terminal cleavage/methylation domain-containing protein [Vibrio panuliri]KAB1455416.1 prepilin-type N-terminal cleavage/methylation domain-containing protein [Vibrio panuliri]OLQ86964.1 MSHA biogenesis protein MshB [Vibrio panuliri]OLQ95452.1 MSHA biogenesis protein MshB [Vibrio panuliri]
MKNNKQAGFSLVELVVVIVVVGLLAVAALPRFLDVTDEAKKASIEGVAGGFATGVLSARAQWEAEARPSKIVGAEKQNYVNYDGVDFWLTRSKTSNGASTVYRDGYPLDIVPDNGEFPTGLTDQACINLMENLLQNPPKVDTVDNAVKNRDVKYSAQANKASNICVYVQREGGTEHKFEYEIETGRVTVTLQ